LSDVIIACVATGSSVFKWGFLSKGSKIVVIAPVLIGLWRSIAF
jgi:hypothetical protein